MPLTIIINILIEVVEVVGHNKFSHLFLLVGTSLSEAATAEALIPPGCNVKALVCYFGNQNHG